MIADALLAYFHFIAIILLFTFMSIEAVVMRNPLDANGVRLITRVDAFYGASAGLVLVSGLLRVFLGAKGGAFYTGNPVFYAKVGLFLVVGAMSIAPTLRFFRWARALKADPAFIPGVEEQRSTRRIVMAQIHLAALLPLLAVLMSRGIGYL